MNQGFKFFYYFACNVATLAICDIIGYFINSTYCSYGTFSDHLVSVLIVGFILAVCIITVDSLTKNIFLAGCLSYLFYAIFLFIIYNRGMEAADLVWDLVYFNFKIAYTSIALLQKRWGFMRQDVLLSIWVFIQGILSSLVMFKLTRKFK